MKLSHISLAVALTLFTSTGCASGQNPIEKTADKSVTQTANIPSATSIQDNVLSPIPIQRIATVQVTKLLDGYHYLGKPLDKKMGKKILDTYIDSLDPSRKFFTQQDIKEFTSLYGESLAHDLQKGKLAAPYAIYQRLQQRLDEYYNYANKMLAKPVDLTTKEIIKTDREDAEFFATKKEQQEYWRKSLVLRLINITVQQKEEKAKEEALRKNPALALGEDIIRNDKRTPVQILQKRLNRKRAQVSRIKTDTVLEGILNAALASYDPHSSYYAPVKATDANLRSNLSLEGIGVSIGPWRKDRDYTQVKTIVEGGPTSKNNQIKKGELIIGVAQDKGEMVNVIGWSLPEIVALIRGKKGTKVTIRVIKAGADESRGRNVVITRDVIKQEEMALEHRTIKVKHNNKNHTIGVIEIPSFYYDYMAQRQGKDYKSVHNDTVAALKALNKQNISGLVVDLRNNPGGSLNEVARMLGLFIKEGGLVQIRDGKGEIEIIGDGDKGKQLYKKPVVVIINLASASASEIFSAAIQDYGRGIVVGSTTTGKGSAQSQINSIAHGQMTLTQRKFYRINGGSTQNKGVIPDVELVNIYDDELSERGLDNALQWDTISAGPYEQYTDYSKVLPSIIKKSKQRTRKDPEFVYLDTVKKLQIKQKEDDKAVMLDINKRFAYLKNIEQQTLQAENKRRVANGQPKHGSWYEFQAYEDAKAEKRSKMKRSERPKLKQEEAFVYEAAHIMLDSLAKTNKK